MQCFGSPQFDGFSRLPPASPESRYVLLFMRVQQTASQACFTLSSDFRFVVKLRCCKAEVLSRKQDAWRVDSPQFVIGVSPSPFGAREGQYNITVNLLGLQV